MYQNMTGKGDRVRYGEEGHACQRYQQDGVGSDYSQVLATDKEYSGEGSDQPTKAKIIITFESTLGVEYCRSWE